jgi:starch synthase (maltosyl-transferring)
MSLQSQRKERRSVSSRGEPLHYSLAILDVSPQVDCGRFSVKRIVGDKLEVSADIVKPENYSIRAILLNRKKRSREWSNSSMDYNYNNDRWMGSFPFGEIGRYEYAISAWTDKTTSLIGNLVKWLNSGEDTYADFEDLHELVGKAIANASGAAKSGLSDWLKRIQSEAKAADRLRVASESKFIELMNASLDKSDLETHRTLEVIVEPQVARYGNWYEMFHRSQGTIPGRSATFVDCEKRLPEIRGMGFDVVYLPPIHPIGRTGRRGGNNTPNPKDGEPGSPWAIGNEYGGHMAVNPDLGTMDDFLRFVEAAKRLDMRVALDLAFQCSPDHPYVKEHPEWFYHRKDGTIRYAENPPKKYYDIVPFFFGNQNWKELWNELLSVVLFWIDKGVKIFRVDNPHTKPFGFWEWLISKVKDLHPEVIFLSEAFTRPKTMKLLAKAGFSQSYTYFTWKNTKRELEELVQEFVISDVGEYYRGNFFTNTPDILSEYLQKSGRPAFKIRLALAATLSSSYGIYNGFELCENRAVAPGSEEYLDSEKYQYKVWDWDRPGNIKEYISKINRIRAENPALQFYRNLHLLKSDSNDVIFYGKWTEDKSNVILVAVNLDPFNAHDSKIVVPLWELGLSDNQSYRVRELITGNRSEWKGETNYVKLDPNVEPAQIFLLEK